METNIWEMNLVKDLPVLNHPRRFREGLLWHMRKLYKFWTARVSEEESFKILGYKLSNREVLSESPLYFQNLECQVLHCNHPNHFFHMRKHIPIISIHLSLKQYQNKDCRNSICYLRTASYPSLNVTGQVSPKAEPDKKPVCALLMTNCHWGRTDEEQ